MLSRHSRLVWLETAGINIEKDVERDVTRYVFENKQDIVKSAQGDARVRVFVTTMSKNMTFSQSTPCDNLQQSEIELIPFSVTPYTGSSH